MVVFFLQAVNFGNNVSPQYGIFRVLQSIYFFLFYASMGKLTAGLMKVIIVQLFVKAPHTNHIQKVYQPYRGTKYKTERFAASFQ